MRTAMKKPAVLERFASLGVESAASTPEEFRKFFLAELKAYGRWPASPASSRNSPGGETATHYHFRHR